MGLAKEFFILSIISFAACVVTIKGETAEQVWTQNPNFTVEENKCGNELKDQLWDCLQYFDSSAQINTYLAGISKPKDDCAFVLSVSKCYNTLFQNNTDVCDPKIQKSIWEKWEIYFDSVAAEYESWASHPECQCLLGVLREKSGKQPKTDTTQQCSNYEAEQKCVEGIRETCLPKDTKQDNHDLSLCADLFALYKCYDDQFQNTASCNDDMRKPFWEKELRFLVNKNSYKVYCQAAIWFVEERIKIAGSLNCTSESDRQCQNVIQFIDEKIENADQECNSTDSLNCTWLLLFYERSDEQFQNRTNYDTKLQRTFWENEKLFLNEWSPQCRSVIQFIDEKIKDSGKPNGADAFGIQSTVIGAMTIISVFLKNMAVFYRMS
ncbi:hypothetical protein DdX_21356 [Ditylenchus destructor]|uniref:Uncharacterized protein n=1 Tax=Ditylenchus destructor TaxID=166010 RepID=A0AAD4QVC5_9BILA|nr:hypothetical protein DdX_21356 [Ditylenchus destructor]